MLNKEPPIENFVLTSLFFLNLLARFFLCHPEINTESRMKYNASVKFPTLKELRGFIMESFVITERFVSPLLHYILVYTIQTQTYERYRVKIKSTQQFFDQALDDFYLSPVRSPWRTKLHKKLRIHQVIN
jgi:hypothetical protein